jgi:hypothetical protein
MAILVYSMRTTFTTRVFPSDTIRRVVDSILQQSEYISTMKSPEVALIQSRECQASLHTLIQLVGGGQHSVDIICGIDTERLQNILYFQQKQIQEYINESNL